MPTPSNPVETPDDATLRLLRTRDVADRLAISASMAWKLIATGELRAVRLGRAVRVRPSDLEAYIDRASEDD